MKIDKSELFIWIGSIGLVVSSALGIVAILWSLQVVAIVSLSLAGVSAPTAILSARYASIEQQKRFEREQIERQKAIEIERKKREEDIYYEQWARRIYAYIIWAAQWFGYDRYIKRWMKHNGFPNKGK